MDALNSQVGGDHYKNKAIQPVEYIHANRLGFCEGNIVKYVSRWRDKGGVDDLRRDFHTSMEEVKEKVGELRGRIS